MAYSGDYTIPSTSYGPHTIELAYYNGVTNVAVLDTSFTVLPSITLSHNAGSPNAQITLNGYGFASGSSVSATLGGVPILNLFTTGGGVFTTTPITVPNLTPGTYTLTVTDDFDPSITASSSSRSLHH